MVASRTIVAASLEDDRLVLTRAVVVWSKNDKRYNIKNMEGLESVGRNAFDDENGNIRNDTIFEFIKEFADGGDVPDILAISLYGTVNPDTNVILHVPNRGMFKDQVMAINAPAFFGGIERYKNTRVIVDNDASAAALGEFLIGAGTGSPALAYIWAGRGINAGLILGGELWEGRLHPEVGHCLPRRHPLDLGPEQFEGNCVIHHDCVIGLASRRAIRARRERGMDEDTLRTVIAYYYAQLCLTLTLTIAPERIVIGGLILRDNEIENLVSEIVTQFIRLIKHYPDFAPPGERDAYIRQATTGPEVSVTGMLETARRHLDRVEGKL